MRKNIILTFVALGLSACAPEATIKAGKIDDDFKVWTLADGMLFPADRSLMRPEDGVVLTDGTVLVSDQAHGLAALSPDGTKEPYGNFAAVGYVHQPPNKIAGPNGVALEPDGGHVLVADVFTGAIYRTDIKSETTELIYQHPFGVNTVHRDSTGAIWFSQSTENAGANSETRLFAAVDAPMSDGALFRIAPPTDGAEQSDPAIIIEGLDFANGFHIDEERGALYLSETMADRVLGFRLDVAAGALSDRRVVAEMATPDNIEMDETGRLWVASPIANEVLVIDPDTGDLRPIFRPKNAKRDRIVAEWRRRGEAGEPRLDLLGPELSDPMPGLLTGVILTPGGGPVYISGLGDALVKLDVEE